MYLPLFVRISSNLPRLYISFVDTVLQIDDDRWCVEIMGSIVLCMILSYYILFSTCFFSPTQCAEAVLQLIKDDSLSGQALIVSHKKGTFLYDRKREMEYSGIL